MQIAQLLHDRDERLREELPPWQGKIWRSAKLPTRERTQGRMAARKLSLSQRANLRSMQIA